MIFQGNTRKINETIPGTKRTTEEGKNEGSKKSEKTGERVEHTDTGERNQTSNNATTRTSTDGHEFTNTTNSTTNSTQDYLNQTRSVDQLKETINKTEGKDMTADSFPKQINGTVLTTDSDNRTVSTINADGVVNGKNNTDVS